MSAGRRSRTRAFCQPGLVSLYETGMASMGVNVRSMPLPGMLHATSMNVTTVASSPGCRRQRRRHAASSGLTAMTTRISRPNTLMGR